MTTLSKVLLIVGCTLAALQSCAPVKEPKSSAPAFKGLVIRNTTAQDIDQVRLHVPNTGLVLTTNRILPKGEYFFEFPPETPKRELATLSWNHRGQRYTRQLHETHPRQHDPSHPYRVVVALAAEGQLFLRLE